MSEPKRHDIIKTFRERQDKFVYYLMGLNVAAIGFTVSNTYNLKQIYGNHFMLLIAILSWLFSIAFAIKWILTQFKGMQYDMHQYDINAGVVEEWFQESEPPEGYKEALIEQLNIQIRAKEIRSERAYMWMLILFFSGIVFFLFWRIMEILDILKYSIK